MDEDARATAEAPDAPPPSQATVPFGFRSVFILRPPHDLGPMDVECEFCEAKHWAAEAAVNKEFELCCKKGDAILEYLRPPPAVLRALLEGDNPRARSFRQYIRAYNSALTFTSVSYTKDTRIDLTRGVHCFQIHEELFYYQGPLIPGSQDILAFA